MAITRKWIVALWLASIAAQGWAQEPQPATPSPEESVPAPVEPGVAPEAVRTERALREEAARDLERQGKWAAAAAAYEALLSDYPDSAEYHFRVGRWDAWNSRWNDAEAHYRQALELKAGHVDVRVALGYLHLWRGNAASAREEFEAVLLTSPEYPDALVGLGQAHRQAGDDAAAEAAFLKVLDLDPNQADALCQLGKLRHRRREFFAAQGYLDQALQSRPNHPEAELAMFRNRPFTQPSIAVKWRYTEEREEDDVTGHEVARLRSWGVDGRFLLPLSDAWRVGLQAGMSFQREDNPFADRENYDLAMPWMAGRVEFRPRPFWTIVVQARGQRTEELSDARFDVDDDRLFEPSASVTFDREPHRVTVSVQRDSVLGKDFDSQRLRMIPRDVGEAVYSRSLPFLSASAGIRGQYAAYHDHSQNNRTQIHGWTVAGFPGWEEKLKLRYEFQWTRYDEDVSDYYSYDRQISNAAGAEFHHAFNEHAKFEMEYRHAWRSTREMVNPDSPTSSSAVILPEAETRSARSNRIEALFQYRHQWHGNVEIGGFYYWDDDSYRASGMNLSFSWNF